MATSGEWNSVGYSGNPVTGNPDAVDTVTKALRELSDLAGRVNTGLDTLLTKAEDGGFEGRTADALRKYVKQELKTFMANVNRSFDMASEATARYGRALRDAQMRAENSADTVAALERVEGEPLAEDDPELTRARNEVDAEVDGMQAEAKILEDALREASRLVSSPLKKPKKSFWKKFVSTFFKVLEVVTLVLTLVAVVVTGPLGLVAFGLSAVLFTKALVDYATGNGNALSLGLAFMGILFPSTKGLTTAAGLTRMASSGAKAVSSAISAGGRALFRGGKAFMSSSRALLSLTGQGLLRVAGGIGALGSRAVSGLSVLPRVIARTPGMLWSAVKGTGRFIGSSWKQGWTAVSRDFALTTGFVGGNTALRVGAYSVMSLSRFTVSALLPLRYSEIAMFGYGGAFRIGFFERGLHWTSGTTGAITRTVGVGGNLAEQTGKSLDHITNLGSTSVARSGKLAVPGTAEFNDTLDELADIAVQRFAAPTTPEFSSLARTGSVRSTGSLDDLGVRLNLDNLDTLNTVGLPVGTVSGAERLNVGTIGTGRGLDDLVSTRLGTPLTTFDEFGAPIATTSPTLTAPRNSVEALRDLDTLTGVERTGTGLLKPIDELGDLAELSLDGRLGGLTDVQVRQILDGEIDLVNVTPAGAVLRVGKTDPVDVRVQLKDGVQVDVLGPADTRVQTWAATGAGSLDELGIQVDDLTRLIPDTTEGTRTARELLGMGTVRTDPATVRVTTPAATTPLTLRDIVTGGATGKLGTDRFQAWIRTQSTQVQLDTAGRNLDGLTKLAEVPPLGRAQAELDLSAAQVGVNQARIEFGRLGMNLDTVRQDITVRMALTDSSVATLPTGELRLQDDFGRLTGEWITLESGQNITWVLRTDSGVVPDVRVDLADGVFTVTTSGGVVTRYGADGRSLGVSVPRETDRPAFAADRTVDIRADLKVTGEGASGLRALDLDLGDVTKGWDEVGNLGGVNALDEAAGDLGHLPDGFRLDRFDAPAPRSETVLLDSQQFAGTAAVRIDWQRTPLENGGFTLTDQIGDIRLVFTADEVLQFRDVRLPTSEGFLRFEAQAGTGSLPRTVGQDGLALSGVTVEPVRGALGVVTGVRVQTLDGAWIGRFDLDATRVSEQLTLSGPVGGQLTGARLTTAFTQSPGGAVVPAYRLTGTGLGDGAYTVVRLEGDLSQRLPGGFSVTDTTGGRFVFDRDGRLVDLSTDGMSPTRLDVSGATVPDTAVGALTRLDNLDDLGRADALDRLTLPDTPRTNLMPEVAGIEVRSATTTTGGPASLNPARFDGMSLSGADQLTNLRLRVTELPATDLTQASFRIDVVDFGASGGPVRLPEANVTVRESGGFTITGIQGGVRWEFDALGQLTHRELPLSGTDLVLRLTDDALNPVPQVAGPGGVSVPGATLTPVRDTTGALSEPTVRVPMPGSDGLTAVRRLEPGGVLRHQELPLTLTGLDSIPALGVRVTITPGTGGTTTRVLELTGPSNPTRSFRLGSMDGGFAGVRTESLGEGRIAVIRTGTAAQPLERTVFSHTGTLLEETVAVRIKGGRAGGEYWKIDHAAGNAVRVDRSGNALTGRYTTAKAELSATGQLRLTGEGKVTLFEREVLGNGNILHIDQDAVGRHRWTEFDRSGAKVRSGERIWDSDRRTIHDTLSYRWMPIDVHDVRTYTKAIDGGLIRAEKTASGDWTWTRFDTRGTKVLSGTREWSWNHIGFKDTYLDPVTGRPAVAQQRGNIWPLDGYHGSRQYLEHPMVLGESPARMRVNPELHSAVGPANKPIDVIEQLADGSTLHVVRLSDQRIPAAFWKPLAGEGRTQGFFANFVTGDSMFQVSKWTETATDGTRLRGVRLLSQGNHSWRDIDEFGRIVRETRKMENGNVVEVGRGADGSWAPAPKWDGSPASYELPWRDTRSNVSGTRHVSATGGYEDVFTNAAGDEVLALRTQGTGVREYLADNPLRGLGADDVSGVWVDKNTQLQITGRRDHWGGQYVEAHGEPSRRTWTWKATDTDGTVTEGVRIQNRGTLRSRTWDDSFIDYERSSNGKWGTAIRERNATDDSTVWIDATRQPDSTWTWRRTHADGTLHSEGVRTYRGRDQSHWTDRVGEDVVRYREGGRVREYTYTVNSQVVAPSVDTGRITLSNLLSRSALHFEPQVSATVDRQVWKEYDMGRALHRRDAVAGAPGRYQESEALWGQWREYQGGRVVAQRTITGRVWATDAFGRWATRDIAKLPEMSSLPKVGGEVGLDGHRSWRLIGRENEFRGYTNEFRGLNREFRDPFHEIMTGVDDGSSTVMPTWQHALRRATTDFTTSYVLEFGASLATSAIMADLNNIPFDAKIALQRAALTGAITGTIRGGINMTYDTTRLGNLKYGLSNLDQGQSWNRHSLASVDDWATEWAVYEIPTRWRSGAYSYFDALGFSTLAGFVNNAVSASVFGVGGEKRTGLEALEAGAWGAAGSLFTGVSAGLVRNIWHTTAGSRVFHRGGAGEMVWQGAESLGTANLNYWLNNRGAQILPSRAFESPGGTTTPATPQPEAQQPSPGEPGEPEPSTTPSTTPPTGGTELQ